MVVHDIGNMLALFCQPCLIKHEPRCYCLQETACFSGRYSTEVADPDGTRMKRSGFVGINSVVSATGATELHTAVLCDDTSAFALLC